LDILEIGEVNVYKGAMLNLINLQVLHFLVHDFHALL